MIFIDHPIGVAGLSIEHQARSLSTVVPACAETTV
jgi:hypothetical protein